MTYAKAEVSRKKKKINTTFKINSPFNKIITQYIIIENILLEMEKQFRIQY